MLDDMIETISPACSWREDAVTKRSAKIWRPHRTALHRKRPYEDVEFDASAAQRQVLCSPPIPALDALRDRPAGHGQAPTVARTQTSRSHSIAIPSTINPEGTKLAARNRCFNILIQRN